MFTIMYFLAHSARMNVNEKEFQGQLFRINQLYLKKSDFA